MKESATHVTGKALPVLYNCTYYWRTLILLNLVRCAAKFSVNVRTVALIKFASRSLHTVFLAAAKSRTLELLAFDEYCRFDTFAFF